MLQADRIDIWPLNNAPSVVANFMNPSHVESVFIGGKAKKWRGRTGGRRLPRVLKLAQDAREGLMRRTGHKLDLMA